MFILIFVALSLTQDYSVYKLPLLPVEHTVIIWLIASTFCHSYHKCWLVSTSLACILLFGLLVYPPPTEPAAVQGIVVTSNSSTRVQVNWMTPTAMGNTIIGYQIQVFIVDVNMNKSNQTISVGNVSSTEVDMLCELELWEGLLSWCSLCWCQLSVCGLSVV